MYHLRDIRDVLSKFVLNITNIQHEAYYSHIQCPNDAQAPTMCAAACQHQVLK
jgi:hypothetical protein